ncbi:MAG: 16S rRNA (cytosine(1402)-N(4))-methyltransferase RsmH [Bacteroidales bacterium]|jgi:16S rRNA (cytosine1402-N4)-methyltransferase|nr:16S rRNA (cytosine(1402)-N(4))-methyltransferase RsmH [Bacteroidales bacterium]HOA10125.1 16S rRNA (cytosine(1402)-N(4))-methyltransferase RsmH [Tenuifilaceae bacterium]MBP8643886.1 16S rRNA (cytosine(1402)-N(4))-methyltransferase RsmH [Bacteroidales bacterium]NLI88407.1 16S rRNA (cytosine(1402)-N(4))-methyltransferase RsmH [Bacteroidales bacterium]HOC37139.1 16S rRNA (cytosine(1402)-N(4))-methyltransferase RsmH [Tenuifilaceae bacterium]
MTYHVPVLLAESIEGLNIRPDGTYVDLTYGGGGHSRHILERLGKKGKLYAFDQDEDALTNASDDKRFTLIRGNFKYFRNFLRYYNVAKVDGILADLGVSSFHLDTPERGFSFRFEGPLDMRMNKRASLTAKKVVNSYSIEELSLIFNQLGELPDGRRYAQAIYDGRKVKQLETIEELTQILKPLVPAKLQNKVLAKIFQALRIEVNHELDALKLMLVGSAKCLGREGRLVVISYHSLEDRLVKNFLKFGNFEGEDRPDLMGNRVVPFEQVNRKVIVPSFDEISANNRARSAKLRIGRRL